MGELQKNNPGPDYVHLLAEVKERIRSAHNLVIMRKCVEYALHDARKPIGVATYEITRTLPKELRGQLPQPEEIVALLEGIEA